MAGRLSFSIAINLLTENFKRGSNQVKAALKSMQMQILTFAAALGAGGIGLSNLITRFVDVARETNRATTALKNVSGGMSQYADNQKYLLDMAKKYGLEINALTGNYAKFTAAASVSGMSMMNQRKIFESMSRAVTAFGMSADDSNGVFLALSQMMSKGKISSEELRLQMGERLPIALQAMAKAAGVSVAGLDKLLKQGRLMSKDVLPKFAEELSKMIPNVDTDNLETSANKLKNTFTGLVDSSGIKNKYKELIDWLNGAIQSASENIKNITIGVLALITGAIANGVVNWWASISSLTTNLEANLVKSNAVLLQATQQRIAAEIALEKEKTISVNAETKARIALETASKKEQVALEQVANAEQKVSDLKRVSDAQVAAKFMIKATQERVAAEISLETAKTELLAAQNANRQAQTYNETLATRTRLQAAQEKFSEAETKMSDSAAKEIIASEEAKAAAAEVAAIKSQSAWIRFSNTTKMAIGKLVLSLRSLWSTFAPMAIVTVIVAIIAKFVEMRKEAERIRTIFSEYKKGAESISHSPEIIQLQVIRDLYNKAAEGSKLKEKYQNRIVGLLGGELKKNQSINDAVRERIKLLEASAKVDYFTRQKIDSEEKLKSIYNKRGGEESFNFQYKNAVENRSITGLTVGGQPSIFGEAEEAVALRKIIEDADSYIYKYTELLEKNKPEIPDTSPLNDLDADKKKNPLQKQQESYDKQFEELKAELEIGKITQAEYNKVLGELNIKMYAQAKGTGEKKVLESEYFKGLKTAAETAIQNQDKNAALVELEKTQKDYNDKVKENEDIFSKGLMSQKELDENIRSLSVEAAKSAAGIKGIGSEADAFIAVMQMNAKLLSSKPSMGKYDATFDYKKNDTDIISDKLDIAKKYRDDLKSAIDEGSTYLETEFNEAISKVNSMEDALKIAQVKQDVKDFSKELNESIYSGVKEIASSSDRMVSAFESLDDVMNDVDASGWERIMAVWNVMTSSIDGFLSIISTIETLTELTDKLTKAKEAEAAIDTAVTGTKISNKVAETTAETTALATQTAAEVTASATKSTAASVEMAAKSTAAYAAIPFVGIGLASAQIAAMQSLIIASSIPKFANGGIITGGPTSGDKILARVNAGEMILNQGQQANLFAALKSGKTGGSSEVVIGFDKVRGSDIFLSLKNYMKSTGKKL